MKHTLIIIFIIFLFSFTSLHYSEKVKTSTIENITPAKTFKEYIAKHINSYKKDKRKSVTLLGGGWVNVQYQPKNNYKTAVIKKTNSKITPYIGICEFTLVRHFTAFHKNKEDAAKDTKFIKSDKSIHKHLYGLKKNKWVVTSRTHKGYSSWYDCNEIPKKGPLKGLSNIFGCWEK